MASRRLDTLKLSLGLAVPLIIDLAYHEGYLVPTAYPGYWTQSRFDRFLQFEALQNLQHSRNITPNRQNSALYFTRYRTENPVHASFVHTKKSVWRFNSMWPFVAGVTSLLQIHSLFFSVRTRAVTRVLVALGAMGLTWTGLVLEGESRYLFLQGMKKRVEQEEQALSEMTAS